MADIEKVEKGLAFCNSGAICAICNYRLTEESEKACDDILHADALFVIRELQAENERLRAEQPKWIPVEERLPENAQHKGAKRKDGTIRTKDAGISCFGTLEKKALTLNVAMNRSWHMR